MDDGLEGQISSTGLHRAAERDWTFGQLAERLVSSSPLDRAGHGIMAVWLATWEMEEPEVKMLVRAFVEAFPYASVWDSQHLAEWILVGSMKPLSADLDKLRQRMNQPLISADLAKIGLRTPADFLALYMKGPEFLEGFTGGVPPVTDDHSVVDYTTPRRARANFGLGESLTGGLNVSGISRAGLVSELHVRDFDAIYTHRDRPSSVCVCNISSKSSEIGADGYPSRTGIQAERSGYTNETASPGDSAGDCYPETVKNHVNG